MSDNSDDVFCFAEYFEYLDDLRAVGATNMFGAAPYVASAFLIPRAEAHVVLSLWIKTFDGKSSTEDRARKALAGHTRAA